MRVILSQHAMEQIAERGLNPQQVIDIAAAPEQIVYPDALPPIAQSRITIDAKIYLLRVVFRDDVQDGEAIRLIITAYRTSQVEKYWQDET